MTEQLVQLAPEKVLADDNSRFNLKKPRIDELATSILEAGGVLVPVEVEPLTPPQGVKTHRLVSGFYRHAAVTKLNAEQGAGLTLPAMVRVLNDETVRLQHQITENNQRENLSPMDQAVAIKRLLDAQVPRQEIRRIFARPSGPKGTSQPASNAWLNITLRFLDLPKGVQEKIHDGRVGVKAAYELGKVPAEKRAAVLERAEAEREAEIDRERKDEEKYLQHEKKLADAKAKAEEAVKELETTKEDEAKALALITERTAQLRTVQAELPTVDADEKVKRAALEKVKAAEADVKAAEKLAKDTKAKLERLQTKVKTSAQVAAEKAKELEAARKGKRIGKAGKGTKTGAVVSSEAVQRAAKAEGVESAGAVPLKLAEIREAVDELALPGTYPKVSLIGQSLKRCFDGISTPKELWAELAVITGERASVKLPAAKAQPLKPGQKVVQPAAATA